MAKVKRSSGSAPAAPVPAPAAKAPKFKKSALAPPPSAATVAVTTTAKVKRSAPAPAQDPPAAKETTPEKGAAAASPNVIEITSSPDRSSEGSSNKKARKRPASLSLDDEVEMWTPREKRRIDEDCQILAADPLAAAEVAPATPAAATNDDISVVAERGKVACRDYPHPRSACAKHPFNTTPHEHHCDKCFCYVCDIAAPCMSWNGTVGHCHASDKDQRWKTMRLSRQKQTAVAKKQR